MCNGDYVFCGTRSGDIVKLYVDLLAENGSKNASIVAAAVKKAPSRSGMNAGKFTGGTVLYIFVLYKLDDWSPFRNERFLLNLML